MQPTIEKISRSMPPGHSRAIAYGPPLAQVSDLQQLVDRVADEHPAEGEQAHAEHRADDVFHRGSPLSERPAAPPLAAPRCQ